MSLATRCPHCKTVFQVNEEQLKFRSGTVRCGICHDLFNGIDNLVGRIAPKEAVRLPERQTILRQSGTISVSTTTPATHRPTDTNNCIHAASTSALSVPENMVNDDADPIPLPPDDALKEAFNRQLQTISLELNDFPESGNETESGNLAFQELSPVKVPSRIPDTPESGNIPVDDELAGNSRPEETEPGVKTESSVISPQPVQKYDSGNNSVPNDVAPDDLIRIIQQKRKKSRISQIFWSIGVILLVLCLCGQILYLYSERIVLWWPPAKNLVDSACEILACPVKTPPKSSSPFHIEYSRLVATEGSHNLFTQQVTIRNDSLSQQSLPSLVMEITDFGHNLLSRRILGPEEYLPEKSGIAGELAPSEEIHFQLDIEYQHDSAINSRITLLYH